MVRRASGIGRSASRALGTAPAPCPRSASRAEVHRRELCKDVTGLAGTRGVFGTGQVRRPLVEAGKPTFRRMLRRDLAEPWIRPPSRAATSGRGSKDRAEEG